MRKDQRLHRDGMKRISASGGFEVTAKEADNTVTVNTGESKQGD